MTRKFKVLFFLTLLICSCKAPKSLLKSDAISVIEKPSFLSQISKNELHDSTFVNLKDYDNNFVYDIKYATKNNFLNTKVYDCPECFLRLKTVKALINANNSFLKLGFKK